jgi:hypothetical protein
LRYQVHVLGHGDDDDDDDDGNNDDNDQFGLKR